MQSDYERVTLLRLDLMALREKLDKKQKELRSLMNNFRDGFRCCCNEVVREIDLLLEKHKGGV